MRSRRSSESVLTPGSLAVFGGTATQFIKTL
jgi:hypothetical protein